LVVDAALLQTSSHERLRLETTNATLLHSIHTHILTHITLSHWTRRLWTLQEARLAKEVFFIFQDEMIDAAQILKSLETSGEHLDSSITSCVRPILATLRPSMGSSLPLWAQKAIDFAGPMGDMFASLASTVQSQNQDLEMSRLESKMLFLTHAIEWRSTTKADDETICLASLLDLDVMEFLEGTVEERMERLVAHFTTFSCDVLFTNIARLERPGFRWSPRSFLNTHDEFALVSDSQQGFVRPQGLTANFHSCFIEPAARPTGQSWYITCQFWPKFDSLPDNAKPDLSMVSAQVLELRILSTTGLFDRAEIWDEVQLDFNSELSLILQDNEGIPRLITPYTNNWMKGLLVTNTSFAKGINFAAPALAVSIQLVSISAMKGYTIKDFTPAIFLELSEWCIG